MANERDIEKLKAIGYTIERPSGGTLRWRAIYNGSVFDTGMDGGGNAVVNATKAHAQSSEGMKVTMADKVRWLNNHFKDECAVEIFGGDDPACEPHLRFEAKARLKTTADSPEATVDALFWLVA